ncbi:MAG: signal peptidase II [Planctomycetaceae bacterium]|nr:MAG: signal peptidase II [Planctomycetaceae bacterium]
MNEKASSKAQPVVASADWAMRNARVVTIFIMVSALGLGADLLSKHYAFASFLDNPQLAGRIQSAGFVGDLSGVDAHEVLCSASLRDVFQRQVAPGMKFTLSTNPGIVFGYEKMPRWLVNVATVLTVFLVCFYFATSHRQAWIMHVALAFIIGGALGNLYDRVYAVVQLPAEGLAPIKGQVRDFIDFTQIGYSYIFNVADVLLVAGVALIFIEWMIQSVRRARAAKPGESAK